MLYVEHLKGVGDNIDNVKFNTLKISSSIPRFCGMCPSNPNESGLKIDILHININNPKNWDKLESLLHRKAFNLIENRYVPDGFSIDIDKRYSKIVKCTFYKKFGFDDAFTAMKILKPKLTEFDFAFTCGFFTDGLDEPDYDLVTKNIYNGDSDCIHNDDGSVYIFEEEDRTVFEVKCVNITISITDLILNRDILTEIILTQK